MRTRLFDIVVLQILLTGVTRTEWVSPSILDRCPGYNVTNVKSMGPKLSADLVLAGAACNVFGSDARQLKLEVTCETGMPPVT